MRPGVRADGVPVTCHLAHHGGVGDGHAPDHEECGLGAVLVERLEDGARIGPQRPVVEGQHDLAIGEEIERRKKGGESEMKASMDVMKKYRTELAMLMQK